MLRTADLDYDLPEDLIATAPAAPRESARLMVLHRSRPGEIDHLRIADLPDLLAPSDLLVVNRTHVLPARFRGVRVDTGGRAEGLFIRDHTPTDPASPRIWQALIKLRRMRPGTLVRLDSADGQPTPIHLRLLERVGAAAGDEAAGWLAAVEGADPGATTQTILARIGLTPLPPYILAARKRHEAAHDEARDRETYQTVFAQPADDESRGRGSVAAPTAGLHFTPALLDRIAARGIERAEVILHVGMGTFKPVETEFVEQHPMHAEWCQVPGPTAHAIARCTGRLIAVGTTTARTLESFDSVEDMLTRAAAETGILITPGHRFRHVEALMTNFHLPRSTLMAMVAAFLDDTDGARGTGLAQLLAAYRIAIEQRYRFYSFGDAMLILP